MALERKPLRKTTEPGYPDAQEYVNDRRSFLLKLGVTAAGLLGLAGCLGKDAPPPAAAPNPNPTPTPTPTAPNQPLGPGLRPNGRAPEPPIAPQACMPGKQEAIINSPVQPIARPTAPSKGDAKAPAPVQPPARPQAAFRGEESAPVPPARPQADLGGKPRAVELDPPKPDAGTKQ